jgi:hypothetical protein
VIRVRIRGVKYRTKYRNPVNQLTSDCKAEECRPCLYTMAYSSKRASSILAAPSLCQLAQPLDGLPRLENVVKRLIPLNAISKTI